ncbi:SPOR domain-containing protein [Mesorhizobium sp. YIM 152430]|uniref:SPOR domain-containing protein n=1 Tax=Mesorhizobium sp. YIM 152430 TaxID=3031761 RepID=UPI0023DCB001|nr:SPOR domain-containing protein [Mesorhizobium sp. YIM 152430]MDF1600018.1 SPOR domain-containing protein [Mesorhizobium sp. YIM 152430]
MADNPFKRPDESGFLDNDPFAELMRMADAPRPATQEASFSANESFDIDLERELLGDFDEPDQASSAGTVADHWSREPEAEATGTEAEPHLEGDEPVDEAMLDDLDMAFEIDMTDEGPHLPLSTADGIDEPSDIVDEEDDTVLPEDFDARSHALFAAVPELADEPDARSPAAIDEPAGDEFDQVFADFDIAGDLEPEIAAEPQLVADPISFDDLNEERDPVLESAPLNLRPAETDGGTVSDDDIDFAFDAELEIAEEDEDRAGAPIAGDAVEWRTEEGALDPASLAERGWSQGDAEPSGNVEAADAAPSFGHDDVLQAGPAADHERQSEYALAPETAHDARPDLAWKPLDLQPEGPVEPVSSHVEPERSSPFEPQLRRDIADDDDILNDIENWLGTDAKPETPRAVEPAPASVPPVEQPVAGAARAPVAPDPQPLSLEDELSALLGDEAAPVHAVADEPAKWEQPSAFDAAEIDLALDLEFDEPELQDVEPDTFDLSDLDADDWQDEADSASFEPDETADAFEEVPVTTHAGRPTEEPVVARKTGPLAMLAALAPAAMARFGGGERSSIPRQADAPQPATPLFGMARANRPVAPEIETVDVEEQPVALVDDLEIPELSEPEEVAPLFSPDDLEAELDVAFGSLATEDDTATQPAASVSSATPEQMPLQGYFVDGEYAYAPEQNAVPGTGEFGDVDFDDDPDAEFEVQQPAPKDGLRRKYFILGGVVAVAIVGGLGYFMAGGPAGSGLPVVVRADSEPVRVRPENRGGATVPNQNSQAYQRATGATGVPGGGQEQLITSAEEPMDVRAAVTPSEPMNDFPLVGMEEIPMLDEAEATNMLASVKSNERLGSVEDIIEEDGIAVAPRRVRTMVVRPDGTLVPRDEVPAAATREELEATAIAATAGQGTAVPLVQDAQPIGTVMPRGEVLADDPVMPDTVGVVPSRPQASAAPAAQPAPVQVAAAAPATQTPVAQSASAAPAVGEWSMQIASQPTAEGAQSAYQDLARRYGSVLEGKGVNIVRADIDGMGTFYRVRIPAATRDEAIRLCESFKSAGGNCFVSR